MLLEFRPAGKPIRTRNHQLRIRKQKLSQCFVRMRVQFLNQSNALDVSGMHSFVQPLGLILQVVKRRIGG